MERDKCDATSQEVEKIYHTIDCLFHHLTLMRSIYFHVLPVFVHLSTWFPEDHSAVHELDTQVYFGCSLCHV